MPVQTNVESWERVASVAIGGALLAHAVRQRRPFGSQAMIGLGLVARGASGFCPVNAAIGRGLRDHDTRRALGGSRGVKLQERVSILRPTSDVFAYWRNFDNVPRFMRHVEQVTETPTSTHWIVQGPAGIRLEWDAEIINEIEPELIAWRSLPGADVVSAGSVHFKPLPGNGTEVTVTLQYDPPGGKAAAGLAWLMGRGASTELREDLRRLKELLETTDVWYGIPRARVRTADFLKRGARAITREG